jgi:hypothetical protein
VPRKSTPLTIYRLELAAAYEKLAQALQAEAELRRNADLVQFAELRELRRAVDSASQAYLEMMRQYVQAFEEAARERE